MRRGYIAGDGARCDLAALGCALCATLFLPWSGIGVLALRTWAFYPLLGLSLLLNARRARSEFFASLSFLFVLAFFVLLTDRFILTGGLPGDRVSIESAGMILRLGSIRSAKLLVAMFLIFAALIFSFLGAYRDNVAGNVAAFAFASFLTLVFLPIDVVLSLNVFPPASVVVHFLLSFAAAIALQRVIRFLGVKRAIRGKAGGFKFFLLDVAIAGMGGWLLLTSL